MLIQRPEELILNQLIHNENYFRRVYPHIKDEYFHERTEKLMFQCLRDYVADYSVCPSPDTLSLLVNTREGITGDEIQEINEYIGELLAESMKVTKEDSLIDQTEDFCQEKAMYNAILDAMTIINGDDKKRTKEVIPDLMRTALKISFNSTIGHDYTKDVEVRFDKLHQNRKKIPFDIEILNKITNGGLEEKTLNCILSPTGTGKTMMMCHCAAAALTQGYNVLYITLEMAEEKIAQRIDANLMDIALDDFETIEKDNFLGKFKKVVKGNGFLSKLFGIKKKKKLGRLFVKEYPTGAGNADHFRFLLDELKLKKDFDADFIVIDYLNICSSTRILPMSGSYGYVKSIAEELRGLAVEYSVPILTGTQTNRNGMDNSDIEITDTSDSVGLPYTLDFYIAVMSNDELYAANRLSIKQLKNRYTDENKNKYFTIGVDRPKMRLFHVDDWQVKVGDDSGSSSNDYANTRATNKIEKSNKFNGISI